MGSPQLVAQMLSDIIKYDNGNENDNDNDNENGNGNGNGDGSNQTSTNSLSTLLPYSGVPTSDQARITYWYSTHKELATIDTKASLFRGLLFGVVNANARVSKSNGGLVCGGTTLKEYKSCGTYSSVGGGGGQQQQQEQYENGNGGPKWFLPYTRETLNQTKVLKFDAPIMGCPNTEKIPISIHGPGKHFKHVLQDLAQQIIRG